MAEFNYKRTEIEMFVELIEAANPGTVLNPVYVQHTIFTDLSEAPIKGRTASVTMISLNLDVYANSKTVYYNRKAIDTLLSPVPELPLTDELTTDTTLTDLITLINAMPDANWLLDSAWFEDAHLVFETPNTAKLTLVTAPTSPIFNGSVEITFKKSAIDLATYIANDVMNGFD